MYTVHTTWLYSTHPLPTHVHSTHHLPSQYTPPSYTIHTTFLHSTLPPYTVHTTFLHSTHHLLTQFTLLYVPPQYKSQQVPVFSFLFVILPINSLWVVIHLSCFWVTRLQPPRREYRGFQLSGSASQSADCVPWMFVWLLFPTIEEVKGKDDLQQKSSICSSLLPVLCCRWAVIIDKPYTVYPDGQSILSSWRIESFATLRRDFLTAQCMGLKSWVELTPPRPGQLGMYEQWGRLNSTQLSRIKKSRLCFGFSGLYWNSWPSPLT